MSETSGQPVRGTGWKAAGAIAILCLLSLLLLAYPLYVIRPFRHQGSRELAAALAVTRMCPALQVLLALAAVSVLIWQWRRMRSWQAKAAASFCALLVIACGVLSRVNVYELMFHPMDRLSFSAGAKAKLEGDEEVLAVRRNGVARAYPIRSLSYHHIVNDTLGGSAIVATY